MLRLPSGSVADYTRVNYETAAGGSTRRKNKADKEDAEEFEQDLQKVLVEVHKLLYAPGHWSIWWSLRRGYLHLVLDSLDGTVYGFHAGARFSMNACTPSNAVSSIMLHAMVCPAN